MARAAAAGMVMVRGECLPLAGTLPLFPVADALGELGGLDGGGLLAAALDAAPGYVREEVGRLLPGWTRTAGRARLAATGSEVGSGCSPGRRSCWPWWPRRPGRGWGWSWRTCTGRTAALDFLTFLVRAGRRGPVRVVATCRGDEAPLAEHVAGWLARVRGDAGTEEIRLGPLSRAEVAGQAAALAGGPVSPQAIDYLYARAEGNAFFTEQLVAAALAGQAEPGRPSGPGGVAGPAVHGRSG